ncbi:type II toxin-antitoxin system RelB/DinJ family antitoxin [Mycoplasma mycoides subsp. capri]|uniref:type II toxin-antitoxin system RelB/DinJ family antitoxin n=1 Tax=Mycoplasma mycoides TaxID=2102 RepID=UPI00223FACBA|nr:type II toxin-antitoxin system RelB/DinJ family antitoxin [Mycoplasma mycoides]QVJ96483.1 type II toxin-antitoxin system RelB/DinJ family antitoxin [Mycoplasma mycoides subsp. capri]QVJ97370.1 type II toxin-antitoxin system RelB/DinJ family antitoxin [Mycoplasma mycoides subsp. capri]QVK00363.1 type II toxin-antitoxin system RelB/DinJ family antitoxin [Mycoplasma mycoides subsp. capri]QVK01248.1 type II toxin-antitoxin system RelB/DinJ family antitoxin [Mycoplasma mycoides subsp. capri]
MKTSLSIKIDKDLKQQAETIFKELGLTTTQAITLFFKATIKQNHLPFELEFNEETLQAIKEAEELLNTLDE